MQQNKLKIVNYGDSLTTYTPFLYDVIIKEVGESVSMVGWSLWNAETDEVKRLFDWRVLYERPNAVVLLGGTNDLGNKAMETYGRISRQYFKEYPSHLEEKTPDELTKLINDYVSNRLEPEFYEEPFTNCIEQAFQNLCFMYERAQQNDIFPIAVSVPPVLSELPRELIITPRVTLNSKIEEYCREHDIPYVDVYTKTLEPRTGLKRAEYSSLMREGRIDPDHFNEKGNELIAQLVFEQGVKVFLQKSLIYTLFS